MPRLAPSDFSAVTFDVYGTLIDWELSIITFLSDWAGRNGVSTPGDEVIMAFDRARAAIQTERPAHLHPDVLRRCFDRISVEFGPSLTTRLAKGSLRGQRPGPPTRIATTACSPCRLMQRLAR